MPLGNPIRKQNESRMVSALATEGQTVFTVQGGYIINHISVFRNGVRLSPAEDFTAGDGSTVTLNNAANIDDRIDFHIFDRFTVQNAIIGAASTQTINGDLVLNGKLFGELDVPSINLTGIVTATELDLNGKGDISGDLNVVGVTTLAKAIIGTGVTIDQSNIDTVGIITATTFKGALTGAATRVTLTDQTGDTSCNVLFTQSATGDQLPHTNSNLTFNSSSGALTATSVNGNIVGGTVSGTTGTFTGDVTVSSTLPQIYLTDTNSSNSRARINGNGGNLLLGADNDGAAADSIIYFEVDGSEKLRIGSAGQLGIAGANYGTSGQVLTSGGSSAAISWSTVNTDLVSDTSPQLGGGLASNGFNINFADSSGTNNMAKFGASGDLQIYHDSAHSRIVDTGTGDLKLQSSKVTIGNAGNSETMATFTENGAVELYHNNIKTLDTVTTGIRIHGDEGATAQLQLLADQGDDNADYWRFVAETDGTLNMQDYGSGSWYNNIRLSGNTGGVILYQNNDAKFQTQSDGVRVEDGGYLYFRNDADNSASAIRNGAGSGGNNLLFTTGGSDRWQIDGSGHLVPQANDSYDVGSSSYRVRNIYTGDLHLSNEVKKDKGGNDVDGTWGDYTIQEGESDLFLINNRSGKKFKFMLQEVS